MPDPQNPQSASYTLVDHYANQYGVDPVIARRMMTQESGGQVDAVSPKGAMGPMQLMPGTAKQLGVDPNNQQQNIEGGVRYLSGLLKRYSGNYEMAVAAYHAGPGAVDKAGGIPDTNDGLMATKDYVNNIVSGTGREAKPTNPFADFAPAEQESIRKQLVQLRNSGQLNDAQSGGVQRALNYLQPTGTTPNTAPPIKAPKTDMQSQGGVGATVTGYAAGLPTPKEALSSSFMGGGGLMPEVPLQRRRQYEAMQSGILKKQLSLDQTEGQFDPVLEFTDKKYDTPEIREYLGMPKAKDFVEKAGEVSDAVTGTATGLRPVQISKDIAANYDSGTILKSGTLGNAASEVTQAALMLRGAGRAEAPGVKELGIKEQLGIQGTSPLPKPKAAPAPIVPPKEALPKAPKVKPVVAEEAPIVQPKEPPAVSTPDIVAEAPKAPIEQPKPAVETPAPQEAVDPTAKEPYEQTLHEYVTTQMANRTFSTEMTPEAKEALYNKFEADHQKAIDDAVASGKLKPEAPAVVPNPEPLKPTPEDMIANAGLVPKGNFEGKVYQFEHPDFPGKTSSLKIEDMTSPEAIKAKMQQTLDRFTKAGGSKAEELAPKTEASVRAPAEVAPLLRKPEKPSQAEVREIMQKLPEKPEQEAVKSEVGWQPASEKFKDSFKSTPSTKAPERMSKDELAHEIVKTMRQDDGVAAGTKAQALSDMKKKGELVDLYKQRVLKQAPAETAIKPPASAPHAVVNVEPKKFAPTSKPIEPIDAQATTLVAKAVEKLTANEALSPKAVELLEQLTGRPLKDLSIERMRHDLKGWQQLEMNQRYLRDIQDRANQVAEAAKAPQESKPAEPDAAPKKARAPRTPKAVAPITVDVQIAKEVKTLEDNIIKENPSAASAFGLIKSAAREVTKDSLGIMANYKRGLHVLLDNIEDPNRVKKAIDAASRKGEGGFIGPGRPAYSDAMLEKMTLDHLDVTFTKWENMTEGELARSKVWETLRSPMMERQVFLANDPLLSERYEQLKTQAVGAELTDPALAMKRAIGGEIFTPGDLARMNLRERLGEWKRSKEQLSYQLEQAQKHFDKLSIKDSVKFTDNMENGRAQATPAQQKIADILRYLLDERRDAIIGLGTGKFEHYIENYFPRMWKMPGKVQQLFSGALARRPLAGKADFMKRRDYQLYIDGLQAGYVPVTYNPVEMALMRINEMDKYLMAHQVLGDWKDIGIARWVTDGKSKKPDGWVPLQDSMFKPTQFKDGGHLRYGQYYAPKEAAKIMDNYLSPGIKGNPVYDAIRFYNNAFNQVNLGLSAFHGFEIMYDSFAGDIALGLRQLAEGRGKEGIKSLGMASTLIGPGLRNYFMGAKGLAEYLSPGTHAQISSLIDDMATAGGVAHQPPEYRNASKQAIQRASKEFMDAQGMDKLGPASRAAANSVPWLLERTSAWIMENSVPRIKVGAFLRLAKDIHERLPNAPAEVITRELDRAWDSVDNRMGEVVYDNLFMNRTFKDIMQISWRSFGWNLGTFREIGGGMVDMAVQGGRKIRTGLNKGGAPPKSSYRMYYPLGMLLGTAYFSSIMMYAMTGHGPTELADYFYPKTGLIDPNGKPERVYGKSYMQDSIAWIRHPLDTGAHKAAPWMSQAYELLWANADYYGREIRHPDDNPGQQAVDVARYLGKSMLPFTAQNTIERMRSGSGVGGAIASGFGIIPAPKWVGQSKFEEYTLQESIKRIPGGSKTADEFERSQEVMKVRNRLTQKMWTPKQAFDEAVKTGKISMDDYDKLLDEQIDPQTPLQRHFSKLPLDVALNGYVHMADPKERGEVQEMLFDKIDNKDPDSMTLKENQKIQDMIKQAVKLPVERSGKK